MEKQYNETQLMYRKNEQTKISYTTGLPTQIFWAAIDATNVISLLAKIDLLSTLNIAR
jgi:hypothetical protein